MLPGHRKLQERERGIFERDKVERRRNPLKSPFFKEKK